MEGKTMKYSIVIQNANGNNLRIFEQDEFDKAIKYMESSGGYVVSAYRIQLVEKGSKN
jgi:hypothetical protein